MLINEFPVNTKITITVKVCKQKVKFNTNILINFDKPSEVFGPGIACKPVMMGKKIIDFGEHPATISIYNKANNRVYKFKTSCMSIHNKRKLLIICSHDDAEASNNRGAMRFPCSYNSILKIGSRMKTIDGQTHDLSYTGASFVLHKEDTDAHIGDPISAAIYDLEEHIYRTDGIIVRVSEIVDTDLLLLGVKFNGDSLHGLIGRLQLRETRVKGKRTKRRYR